MLSVNYFDSKMAEEREKSDVESATAELQKRIADAFDIFDHESNKTVDVRYVILQSIFESATYRVLLLAMTCPAAPLARSNI